MLQEIRNNRDAYPRVLIFGTKDEVYEKIQR